jgi:hypothetical protein
MMNTTSKKSRGVSSLLAGGLAVIAFACFVPSYATAGEEAAAMSKNPVTEESPWESNLRFDGWLVDIDVGLENTAAGLSKSIFIGFDDIINNLDWIVPIGGDFRYKRFGFMPDLVAVKMSGGQTAPGPFFNRANIDLELGILGLPLYYRLIDQPKTSLDILAGARFIWIDLDIGLSGGPLGTATGPASAGTDANIWDGIAGLRLEHNFSEKWYCSIYGDVGTGASDLTWQFLASIGYRVNEKLSLITGYRYLDYELSDENANVDLNAKGIQASVNWKF